MQWWLMSASINLCEGKLCIRKAGDIVLFFFILHWPSETVGVCPPHRHAVSTHQYCFPAFYLRWRDPDGEDCMHGQKIGVFLFSPFSSSSLGFFAFVKIKLKLFNRVQYRRRSRQLTDRFIFLLINSLLLCCKLCVCMDMIAWRVHHRWQRVFRNGTMKYGF